ncbi:MAG: right-handed parallel beta-helix repeat-containing protein, partial [Bacteroidales bacterium]|nr:right-handed parallel beta-helix repeat-containing protein [Bacteroidales bacterium]
MKKLKLFAVIMTAMVFIPVKIVLAENYFVRSGKSTYGNGNGISYENAWSGLGKVKWVQLGAGDVLYICGTITGEYFNIISDGTVSRSFVIDGGYPSDPAIIDAKKKQTHAVRCAGRHNVMIKNLILKNGSSTGLSVGSSQFITIKNITIENSGNIGMLINKCPNVIIRNCSITNSVHSGCQVMQSPYALLEKVTVENCGQAGKNDDNIFIGDGSTDFLVNKCVARNNFSDGTGFDCSGDINNPISGTFSYCWAEEMKGGGGYCASAGTEKQMTVKFEYCVAKECLGPPFAAKESVTAEFYNCVAYVTRLCNYIPINLSGWSDSHSRNLVVKNCIFVTNSVRPMLSIRINDRLVSSNNCWYNLSGSS